MAGRVVPTFAAMLLLTKARFEPARCLSAPPFVDCLSRIAPRRQLSYVEPGRTRTPRRCPLALGPFRSAAGRACSPGCRWAGLSVRGTGLRTATAARADCHEVGLSATSVRVVGALCGLVPRPEWSREVAFPHGCVHQKVRGCRTCALLARRGCCDYPDASQMVPGCR